MSHGSSSTNTPADQPANPITDMVKWGASVAGCVSNTSDTTGSLMGLVNKDCFVVSSGATLRLDMTNFNFHAKDDLLGLRLFRDGSCQILPPTPPPPHPPAAPVLAAPAAPAVLDDYEEEGGESSGDDDDGNDDDHHDDHSRPARVKKSQKRQEQQEGQEE